MSDIEKRKLQELGGSLYIALPAFWTNRFKLKKGNEITILSLGTGKLQIFPEKIEDEKENHGSIVYDEFFFRNIIHEYLIGSDIVRITKSKAFTRKEREEIAGYVNNLMNLEIIEETSNCVTIQNLKTDIPIKNLISRMYYLTKSMMEDLVQEHSNREVLQSIIERDKIVGKFYLAIIMQQRAFLTKRWSDELSFMDILSLRLLINNIEQIGDEIKALVRKFMHGKKAKLKDIQFLLQRYEKAYNSYIKKDLTTAKTFWKTEEPDKQRLSYDDTLVRIYDHIKDISDLVI